MKFNHRTGRYELKTNGKVVGYIYATTSGNFLAITDDISMNDYKKCNVKLDELNEI